MSRIFLGIFLGLLNFSWSLGAFAQLRPIPIDGAKAFAAVPPEILAAMTEEKRAEFAETFRQLAEKLFTIENPEQPLPSEFKPESPDTNIVPIGDSFNVIPTDQDIAESAAAFAERFGSRRWQPEQWQSFLKQGRIVVPSKNYPGRNYTWKFSVLWQEGIETIQMRILDHHEAAMRHLVVGIPRSFAGTKGPTLINGNFKFFKGVADIVSLVIGLVETKPMYTDHEIQTMIIDERREFVVERAKAEATREGLGFKLDLRLYNAKLMAKVNDVLKVLMEQHRTAFNQEMRTKIEAVINSRAAAARFDSPEAIAKFKSEQMLEAEFDHLGRILRASAELDTCYNENGVTSAGIAQILLDRARAQSIVLRGEAAFAQELADKRVEVKAEVIATHPLRSRDLEYIENEVNDLMGEYYRTVRHQRYVAIGEEITQANLAQEAFLFSFNLQHMEREAARYEELSAATVPAVKNQHRYDYWRSNDWIIKQDPETKKYYADTAKTRSVDSSFVGWRLVNGFRLGTRIVNNLSKAILVDGFVNGIFGYKSLFNAAPFTYQEEVNPDTGEIKVNENATRSTLWTDLKKIWKKVYDARVAHSSTPRGWLPKWLSKILLTIPNELGLGVGGTALTVTTRVAGTAALSALSVADLALVAANYPVLGPMSALGMIGFTAIKDVNDPGNESSANPGDLFKGSEAIWGIAGLAVGVNGAFDALAYFGTESALLTYPSVAASAVAGYLLGGSAAAIGGFKMQSSRFAQVGIMGMLGAAIGAYTGFNLVPTDANLWTTTGSTLTGMMAGAFTGKLWGQGYFPLASLLLGRVGLQGIGQVAQAGVNALVFHPGMAGLNWVGGSGILGYGVMIKDFAVRNVLLYGFVDQVLRIAGGSGVLIPAQRTLPFFYRLVSGPGSSGEFLYRVDPKFAELSMLASLELEGRLLWAERRLAAVQMARNNYKDVIEGAVPASVTTYYQLRGMDVPAQPAVKANEPLFQEIASWSQEERTWIDGQMDTLNKFATPLVSIGNAFHRTRMTKEQLTHSVTEGAALLQEFYERAVATSMTLEQQEAFWKSKKLTEGDFNGLAAYYLQKVYGPEIMESFEVSDKDVWVTVENEGLAAMFESILNGRTITPEGERRAWIPEPKVKPEQEVDTSINWRRIEIRDLCATEFGGSTISY